LFLYNSRVGGLTYFGLRRNAISPSEIVTFTIDERGGRNSTGRISVEFSPETVVDDAKLEISEIPARQAPGHFPEGVEMIGNAYAIHWDSTTRPKGNVPATIAFHYDPDDLPEGTSHDDLAIATFDGSQWLRIPSEVHESNRTVIAEVNHFSLKALVRWGATSFFDREVADKTIADINVSGQVEFENSAFAGDPDFRTNPASGLRFALFDTDAILLHEGILDNKGAFDFYVPAGTDVAIDLDVVLRVYADDPQVGIILTQDGVTGVPWHFNSETASYSLSTDTIHFGTITASGEDSSFFNIMESIQKVYRFTNQEAGPVTVIWSGMDREFPNEPTVYDPERQLITLSRNPQTAWDDDLILRLYGEYILHTVLRMGDHLFCDGVRNGPTKTSEPCSAWEEGWGYYFSSVIREDDGFRIYGNQPSLQEVYDLEYGEYPFGQDSSGAVMALLWDLYDENSDGEDAQVPLSVLGNILRENGTQIDSVTSLYNFWSLDDSFNASICEVFWLYEIVDFDECEMAPEAIQEEDTMELEPSITPPQPVDPPPPTETTQPTETLTFTPEPSSTADLSIPSDARPVEVGFHKLSYNETVYGDVTGCCYREGWYFAGRKGDVITLHFDPDFEEDYESIRVYDPLYNSLDSNSRGSAVFENIELPENGYYTIEIDVDFKAYGGTYTLSLETENSPPNLPPPERESYYLTYAALGDTREVGFREGPGFPLTRERWVTTVWGEAGQVLNFTAASGGDLDPILFLLDEDGEWLIDDDNSLGDGGAWIRDYALPYTGYFMVELQFFSGSEGHIDLSLQTEGYRPVEPTDTPLPPPTEAPIEEYDDPEPEPESDISDTCDSDCASRCRSSYNSTTGFCDDDGECRCHCADSQCKSMCESRGYSHGACYAGQGCECSNSAPGSWGW